MVFNSKHLLHVSTNSGHLQVITILLKKYVFCSKSIIYIYIRLGLYFAQRVSYICLGIYMILFEQNCNNLKMAAIGRNM